MLITTNDYGETIEMFALPEGGANTVISDLLKERDLPTMPAYCNRGLELYDNEKTQMKVDWEDMTIRIKTGK